jgi:hypothetical protein
MKLWFVGLKAETKMGKLAHFGPKEKFGQNSIFKIKFFLTIFFFRKNLLIKSFLYVCECPNMALTQFQLFHHDIPLYIMSFR